jgi:hypothetical protein
VNLKIIARAVLASYKEISSGPSSATLNSDSITDRAFPTLGLPNMKHADSPWHFENIPQFQVDMCRAKAAEGVAGEIASFSCISLKCAQSSDVQGHIACDS